MHNTSLKAGTTGGFLLSLLSTHWEEIGKTVLLASIGAIVSFGVSLLLQAMLKRFRR